MIVALILLLIVLSFINFVDFQSGETSVMVTAVSDKNSSASGVGTPLIVRMLR